MSNLDELLFYGMFSPLPGNGILERSVFFTMLIDRKFPFCNPKGQIDVRMYLWNHWFPKYHQKNLIDFCSERFYRLGTCDLLWLFLKRPYSAECITNLVWINFQGRNLSNFLVDFGKLMISLMHSDFIWPIGRITI